MPIPIIECGVSSIGLIVIVGFAGLGILFSWGKKKTIISIIAATIGFVALITVWFCYFGGYA